METPYSKQDEVIDSGVHALRAQAMDTSRMANVLESRRARSVVLPVGLATAAACVLGAVVLMTPTKADAGQFEKVRKAVKKQPAVFERVLKLDKPSLDKKASKWVVACETWKNGSKSGVKLPSNGGTYEVVLDGKKVYEKAPKAEFYEVEFVTRTDVKVEPTKKSKSEEARLQIIEVQFVDAELVLAENEPQTINEILARDGIQFLGVQRGQKKEDRQCDVYRVKVGKDANDTLYYVDSKTDLPFLKEELDEAGNVVRRVEIAFPGEIRLDIELSDKDHVIKVAPVITKGEVIFGRTNLGDKVRSRTVETPKPAGGPVEKPVPPDN